MITEVERIQDKIIQVIDHAAKDLAINTAQYKEKALRLINPETTKEKATEILIKNALENIDEASPEWTFLASRLYSHRLYQQAAMNRGYDAADKYGDFYTLLQELTKKGIYSTSILDKYTKEEIHNFSGEIQAERDFLFDYLGLYTLATRYLATDHDKNTYELPQERWMVIAMYLMQDEDKAKRNQLVEEAYWALSNLYMTVATPTLNNAGKTHGQLSSCFIDTVDDSLQSIYDSNTDIAKLSKNGGGIGVYMGKIRSRGSSIKGFKGMSSGVGLALS